jgi:general secretion pathway protein C
MFFRVAVVSVLVYIAVVVTTAVHSDAWLATAVAPAAAPPAALPPPAPIVVVVPSAASSTRVVDIRRADLEQPSAIARSARIVPALRDGVPSGVKIYAIRPDSLMAAIGFENGDTLRAVNDIPISTAESALEVYRTHRELDHIDLDIERRGEHVRIVVLLH